MARTTITAAQTDARSPINQTLMDALRNNDSDHEDRLLVQEAYGTNWSSQLGTALVDTNMGAFTGNILPDNSNVKSCLQTTENYIQHVPYLDKITHTIATEDEDSVTTSWQDAQNSFIITCYKPTLFSTYFVANLDADNSSVPLTDCFRLSVTNTSRIGTQYIYFTSPQHTGNWPTSDYSTFYMFRPKILSPNNGESIPNGGTSGHIPIWGNSSGINYTCQLQWYSSIGLQTLQIKNTTYYFIY